MPPHKGGIFVLSLSKMLRGQLYFLCCFFFAGVLLAQPPVAYAGAYKRLCPGSAWAVLGGNPTATGGIAPYTYQWQPASLVTAPQAANPTSTATVTTTFTVTVTGANGEADKDTVTIYVYPYSINAGADTTIKEGQTISLNGSASANPTLVSWSPPDYHIYNQNSLTPDVYPNYTLTYTISVVYPGGCTLYDYVTVTVIPGTDLYFYNTMTPNNDEANDAFYIGNIEKYPNNVLEIYNRYGQKVYTKTGYQNDWKGEYLGNELPSGTYFYILDTKTEKGGKHHGQVNIIK